MVFLIQNVFFPYKITWKILPLISGMVNLGNSCYLNSVMQVIFSIPGFIRRFVDESPKIMESLDYFDDPAYNFVVQM